MLTLLALFWCRRDGCGDCSSRVRREGWRLIGRDARDGLDVTECVVCDSRSPSCGMGGGSGKGAAGAPASCDASCTPASLLKASIVNAAGEYSCRSSSRLAILRKPIFGRPMFTVVRLLRHWCDGGERFLMLCSRSSVRQHGSHTIMSPRRYCQYVHAYSTCKTGSHTIKVGRHKMAISRRSAEG